MSLPEEQYHLSETATITASISTASDVFCTVYNFIVLVWLSNIAMGRIKTPTQEKNRARANSSSGVHSVTVSGPKGSTGGRQRTYSTARKLVTRDELHPTIRNLSMLVPTFGCLYGALNCLQMSMQRCHLWLSIIIIFAFFAHRLSLLWVFCYRLYMVSVERYCQYWAHCLTVFCGVHLCAAMLWLSLVGEVTRVRSHFGNHYCLPHFHYSAVMTAGIIDMCLNIAILLSILVILRTLWMRSRALANLSGHPHLERNTGQEQSVQELIFAARKLSGLTIVGVSATFVITVIGFSFYRPMSSLTAIDICINSSVIFLMFKFNHWLIAPCVGHNCNRLCFAYCSNEDAIVNATRIATNLSPRSRDNLAGFDESRTDVSGGQRSPLPGSPIPQRDVSMVASSVTNSSALSEQKNVALELGISPRPLSVIDAGSVDSEDASRDLEP